MNDRRTSRPDVRRAYTSTVVSWVPLLVALVTAAVVGAVTVTHGAAWWVSLIVVAGLVVAGAQVSVARLSIADGRLVARLGLLLVERLDVAQVEEPQAVRLGWRQALGLGMPFGLWVKMTIRPGPALLLRSGAVRLRISTPRPDDAIAVIRAEQATRGRSAR